MNEQLRTIVANALRISPEALADDAESETIEAWDSLSHLDVITAIESATKIHFSTAEIVEMTSLRKIEAALVRHGWKP
jgi:acyl carrier protein